MAVVSGRDLRVYIDGNAVAYATNCTINITAEFDQIAPTSVGAAGFQTIKPRRISGTLTANALYGTHASNTDYKDLFDAMIAGSSVSIVFEYDNIGDWATSGTAYIASLSATGAVNENSTVSATFNFSGAISISVN